MDSLQDLLSREIAGYTLGQLGVSFLVILAAFILRRVFTSIILAASGRLAKRTRTKLDDEILEAVRRPLEYLILIAGIGIALYVLGLPTEPVDVRKVASVVLKVLLTLDVTWLVLRLIDMFANYLSRAAKQTDSRLDDQLIPLFSKSIKVFVGVLAFVLLVQNMGYSVSGLLAGLGIGGLAVGLAAKDTLANVFGSLAILLDRPFVVGDWIAGEGFEGVVEEIGFRSTRIRTFAKTQVSIPNQQLANMTVNNWSRMPRRRIKFSVGVTYKTTADQMEKAVEGIRQILRDMPEIHDDFFLVNFTDFGDSSLDILVYCFTKTVQWGEHLDARQALMVRIMRFLESMGLEVAFPTRSIYLESAGEESATIPTLPGGGDK
jgi:MscS family membrane protein